MTQYVSVKAAGRIRTTCPCFKTDLIKHRHVSRMKNTNVKSFHWNALFVTISSQVFCIQAVAPSSISLTD